MKIFNGTGVKKQGRNWHILVPGGGKNWKFWPKYLPLEFIESFDVWDKNRCKVISPHFIFKDTFTKSLDILKS